MSIHHLHLNPISDVTFNMVQSHIVSSTEENPKITNNQKGRSCYVQKSYIDRELFTQ